MVIRAPYSQYLWLRLTGSAHVIPAKAGIHFLILLAFLANTLGPIPLAQAQEFRLPAPGVMVRLSPPLEPPILKGIKVHSDNPFRFEFILDQGDNTFPLKTEATKLIKYFLASLTIPEKDLWVNLSPYEKDRIIPQSFGLTEMGRDLLAEDYMLKQITASLIYPEDAIGKKFWKRIYEEAAKRYGTTNIPVNTFNKVWIVPEKAVVYENAKAGTAYVVESKLKVMLEQDYLALEKNTEKNMSFPNASVGNLGIAQTLDPRQIHSGVTNVSSLGSQIVHEIVIPELTKEVNENKNFAQLRQVYNSLILATWYKKKIKDSILAQIYDDKNKIQGLSPTRGHVPLTEGKGYVSPSRLPSNEALKVKAHQGNHLDDVEFIYQRYLQAFKKGVYNYIKEEPVFPPTSGEGQGGGTIPRKYFSGGADLALTKTLNILDKGIDLTQLGAEQNRSLELTVDFAMQGNEKIVVKSGGIDLTPDEKIDKKVYLKNDSLKFKKNGSMEAVMILDGKERPIALRHIVDEYAFNTYKFEIATTLSSKRVGTLDLIIRRDYKSVIISDITVEVENQGYGTLAQAMVKLFLLRQGCKGYTISGNFHVDNAGKLSEDADHSRHLISKFYPLKWKTYGQYIPGNHSYTEDWILKVPQELIRLVKDVKVDNAQVVEGDQAMLEGADRTQQPEMRSTMTGDQVLEVFKTMQRQSPFNFISDQNSQVYQFNVLVDQPKFGMAKVEVQYHCKEKLVGSSYMIINLRQSTRAVIKSEGTFIKDDAHQGAGLKTELNKRLRTLFPGVWFESSVDNDQTLLGIHQRLARKIGSSQLFDDMEMLNKKYENFNGKMSKFLSTSIKDGTTDKNEIIKNIYLAYQANYSLSSDELGAIRPVGSLGRTLGPYQELQPVQINDSTFYVKHLIRIGHSTASDQAMAVNLEELLKKGYSVGSFNGQKLLFTLRESKQQRNYLVVDVYDINNPKRNKIGYVIFSYSDSSHKAFLKREAPTFRFSERYSPQAVQPFNLQQNQIDFFSESEGLWVDRKYRRKLNEGTNDLGSVLMSTALELAKKYKVRRFFIASTDTDEKLYHLYRAHTISIHDIDKERTSPEFDRVIDLALVTKLEPNTDLSMTTELKDREMNSSHSKSQLLVGIPDKQKSSRLVKEIKLLPFLVEQPMLKVAEELYKLNIQTLQSSANYRDAYFKKAWITFDFDGLSDHNKNWVHQNIGNGFEIISYEEERIIGRRVYNVTENVALLEIKVDQKTKSKEIEGKGLFLIRGFKKQPMKWKASRITRKELKKFFPGDDVNDAARSYFKVNEPMEKGEWDPPPAYDPKAQVFYASEELMKKAQDVAMQTASSIGGIDLTPANMNIEVKKEIASSLKGTPRNDVSQGIKFHLDPAMLQQLQNATGFVPVIINVQPLKSLSEFLEIKDNFQVK